jgi:RNA polymerase sigma-70 factor (ECF subfamily)
VDDVDALLDAARAGGGWAFARLWEALAPAVTGYLRARGVPDPDDVASEVFLAAFCAVGRFSGDGRDFRAWLFTIAHHKGVDVLRRASSRYEVVTEVVPDVGQPAPSAEHVALDRLATDEALRLLDQLTEDQRAVLLLRVVADLSLAETAAVLDKPVGAVKSLQHRALDQLRRTMAARPVSPEDPDPMSRVR